ncbi:MAG TPA: hypothetical protein VFC19_33775 [Candidatus Limnocylindrales bacterium]|nr:hypothetical protein [Candidatus Limnocylindrales bacterium]
MKSWLAHSAGLMLVIVVSVVTGALSGPARAVAACPSGQPTFLGGTLHGWPDDRALNALIGVDQKDSAGRKVDAMGVPCGQAGSACCGGYSWCDTTNPDIPPEGSDDPALDRSWGRCVAANVVQAFIEVYPKNQAGVTTKTRYGAAAHYYQPITPRATHNIGLRLPVTFEAGDGNTGGVHGYLTYLGHRIPPENITRVRAFTHGRGPECGVEGFSAAADELGYSASLDATWYEVGFLAAGRCGAATQTYTLYWDCVCGGVKRTQSRVVDVAKGAYPRVDISFG